MPLVVLINCNSRPRNKPFYSNIEQPTVQYSLCLVLMSLSKVPPPLQFPYLLDFFFLNSCFPSVNLSPPINVLPKWPIWAFSDLRSLSAGQHHPPLYGQWLLFGLWLKRVKYYPDLPAEVSYCALEFKVALCVVYHGFQWLNSKRNKDILSAVS